MSELIINFHYSKWIVESNCKIVNRDNYYIYIILQRYSPGRSSTLVFRHGGDLANIVVWIGAVFVCWSKLYFSFFPTFKHFPSLLFYPQLPLPIYVNECIFFKNWNLFTCFIWIISFFDSLQIFYAFFFLILMKKMHCRRFLPI